MCERFEIEIKKPVKNSNEKWMFYEAMSFMKSHILSFAKNNSNGNQVIISSLDDCISKASNTLSKDNSNSADKDLSNKDLVEDVFDDLKYSSNEETPNNFSNRESSIHSSDEESTENSSDEESSENFSEEDSSEEQSNAGKESSKVALHDISSVIDKTSASSSSQGNLRIQKEEIKFKITIINAVKQKSILFESKYNK